jgi:hypothetical protein
LDRVRDELEDERNNLELETEAYTRRRLLYEEKEVKLEQEYEKKHADLDVLMEKRKQELDKEFTNLNKAKDSFDTELKVIFREHIKQTVIHVFKGVYLNTRLFSTRHNITIRRLCVLIPCT